MELTTPERIWELALAKVSATGIQIGEAMGQAAVELALLDSELKQDGRRVQYGHIVITMTKEDEDHLHFEFDVDE